MLGQNKSYFFHQSPFYKLHSKKKLAKLLRVSLNKLNDLMDDKNYYTFQKKNKTIVAPLPHLKKVQTRFHQLLQKIQTSEWHFSKKGHTYISNAIRHKNRKYILTVDIEGFYENSRREYVFRFFKYNMKQSNDVAFIIANLLTFNDMLPRGSPTSSLLSFWIFKRAFENIKMEADKRRLAMSIYVDDLTFSSNYPIPENFPFIINKTLIGVGHKLKPSKIKFYNKGKFKSITGCVLDNSGNILVPNNLRNKIIMSLRKFTSNILKHKEHHSVIGRIQSAKQIEKQIFSHSLNELKK